MSLNAFIAGQSVVTPFGDHVPNTNPVERRRADEIRRSSSNSEDPIKLAERTSSLISSYRDFISGNEHDEEMMTDRVVGGDDASMSSAASRRSRPMLREWNHDPHLSPLWSDKMFNDDHDFDDDLSYEKKYRYNRPIFRSKNLKRLAASCAIVLVVTIVSVIVPKRKSNVVDDKGDSVSLEAEKKKTELASLLLEQEQQQQEKGKDNFSGAMWVHNLENDSHGDKPPEEQQSSGTNGASSGNGFESITGNILCCFSSSKSTSTSTNGAAAEGDKASAEAAAESYHPVWYNRSSGWMGTTWREAREFCKSQQQVNDNVEFGLCPYVAYCPMGPHQMPLGGYRDGEQVGDKNRPGDRAPISDFVDGWVHVGSKDSCVEFTISGGINSIQEVESKDDEKTDAPAIVGEGGVEVENVPVTTNTVDEVGEDADVVTGPGTGTFSASAMQDVDNKDDEMNVASAIIGEEEAAENVPAITNSSQEADEDSHVFVPVVTPGPEYYIENEEHDEESSSSNLSTVDSTVLQLHEQFKPLWLSSAEGWKGGSYTDAVAFCNSVRGKQLCPYSVICPNGPGHAVLGGLHQLEFNVDGLQYAPILGGENHWVMVGNVNNTTDDGTEDKDASTSKCMTYRQLEGKNPEWGLNGDMSEVKQHIMCCSID
ncbi:hypothetical protein ACHAW5_002728 [Stephanodiscus triporus]|uniref:DUF7495 domain-containing protein n=1 Tax=Stephanodiscus triporus TaxID=2934178 RepID=A0ABD3P5E6_9STRA